MRYILCLFVTSFAASGDCSAQSVKSRLTLDDLYRFDSPRNAVLSPDGTRLAYSRYRIDRPSRQERWSLWLVEGSRDRARPLETGEPDARKPVFSPDGKWIAFLSTRSRPEGWAAVPAAAPESEPTVDIWLIPIAGGAAIPLGGADKPYGRVFADDFYARLAFSSDGRRLAFIADVGRPRRSPIEEGNDVHVVRPDGGEGYTGWGNAQVWVAHLDAEPGQCAARRIERITDDDVWYADPQWSSDGRSLVVVANKTVDREAVRYSINKNYDLWSIDVETRRQQQLTFGPGPEISPRFSPDGKRLACLSVPRKGPHRDIYNLGVVTLENGRPKFDVIFNHHAPPPGSVPPLAPVNPLPAYCWDGNDHLVYSADDGVRTTMRRVDLTTSKDEPFTPAPPAQPETPPRTRAAWAQRLSDLTPPGDVFLANRELGQVRSVTWESGDGLKIEGVLTLPSAPALKPPCPVIVFSHGGPHGRVTLDFNFTVQLFAAHGYAVLQPNFRGSTGYGLTFLDADRGDFGGGDMRDILAGIEHLAKQGLVDRDQQFAYGTSYGGYMTTWLVGHTRQFRAAVAGNPVTDLSMMWYLSDLPSWVEWEFGGRPWQVAERLRKHSPLTYADAVKTPTLLLLSSGDRRCPPAMGRAFHKALHARDVPTELIIYPDEPHDLRQPGHREDALRRTLDWFQQYRKNSGK